jgi:rhamnulose-1-phosphate aldolase
VALWEKHGVFAIAGSPYEAFDLVDILAKSAKIFFLTRSAGYEPQGLTGEQLKTLKGLGDKF